MRSRWLLSAIPFFILAAPNTAAAQNPDRVIYDPADGTITAKIRCPTPAEAGHLGRMETMELHGVPVISQDGTIFVVDWPLGGVTVFCRNIDKETGEFVDGPVKVYHVLEPMSVLMLPVGVGTLSLLRRWKG